MAAASEKPLVYALVGNPNCGKSTLFNALTGLRQKVGNYPGVTVEKKVGECYSQHGRRMTLIDLPGSYSLNARSPDESVMRDVLLGRASGTPRPDRVVCVVDASNLERHLYLVTQVLELGLPVVLALNMVDVAVERQLKIDVGRLSERLGVPVVATQASIKKGLIELKLAMSRDDLVAPHGLAEVMPVPVRGGLLRSRESLVEAGIVRPEAPLLEPLYLLSSHDPTDYGIAEKGLAQLRSVREQLEREVPGWEDRLVAARYDAIGRLCDAIVRRPGAESLTLTDRLDRVLLHRLWGWAALLLVLAVIFMLIFKVAEAPMGWIEALLGGGEIFGRPVGGLAGWVEGWMPTGDLRSLIIDGAIAGVAGVLVFLPQILILFFFIGLLEDTGYMARLAFMMDRLMSRVGLNGRSFLPILSSYACAVPGVMAARSIDSPKDRLITIMVAPLASCSARLPVYALLIPLLFPAELMPAWGKALILLGLYVLGTAGAFFFAWLFNRTLMKGVSTPLILELPSYKAPSLGGVARQMFDRAWMFVRRAGTIILGLSIILWAALTYPKSSTDDPARQVEQSLAGRLGHVFEPLVRPMGGDWRVAIGLIGAQGAREVFNSQLGVIYAVEGAEDDETPLRERLRQEKHADGRAVYSVPFCLGLLVYFVFAMQCLSTVAIVRRETGGWKWPLFQFGYMTGTGYALAVLIYQIGTRLGAG
ncbi:MAG: ferrous iron transport protein B [Verrucomicrobiales bacterium]